MTTYHDGLGKESLEKILDTAWAGKTLVYMPVCGSTNDLAKKGGSEGMPHGTLYVADEQISGRGRRGRSFHSPSGSSIFMSMLLRPELDPEDASMLTLVSAMAVYDVLSDLVPGCAIKWPNDIVVGGKKLCGILTEMSAVPGKVNYVVTGIGINVNIDAFPEDIAGIATSMVLEKGTYFDRAAIIAGIWKAFEYYYDVFMRTKDLSGMTTDYNKRLVNMNRQVVAIGSLEEIRGIARGINEEGGLLIETESGKTITVSSGEVSVRGVLGYV